MNAAARAIAQGVVIAGNPANIRRLSISKSLITLMVLGSAILCSAFTTITVVDNNRIAMGDHTTLQQVRNDLQTAYGQLLLEANTLSAPERVQTIATQYLDMTQPDAQKVSIIKP